jgi:hypothetical protein
MKYFLLLLLFAPISAFASSAVYLPNLPGYATGTSLGGGHYGLDVSGTFSLTNPTVGAAVPATANYIAGNKAGNLTGLLIGQQTMANSLACVLPSDQSAIPVSQSGAWSVSVSNFPGTQPVSGTVAATQSGTWTVQPGNTANTTAWLVTGTGGTFPATESGTWNVGLNAGSNIVGKVGIDQTTPGTTNRVASNLDQVAGSAIATGHGTAAGAIRVELPTDGTGVVGLAAGANTIGSINNISGTVSLPTGASTSALQTTGNTSLASIVTNTSKAPINTTGSGSAAAATVSTVITLSAPANAVGFVLMNLDTSTANLRWAVGRTATTTLGQQLQPGRDTGFIPVGANVSLVAESGTQNYDIQWVSQ